QHFVKIPFAAIKAFLGECLGFYVSDLDHTGLFGKARPKGGLNAKLRDIGHTQMELLKARFAELTSVTHTRKIGFNNVNEATKKETANSEPIDSAAYTAEDIINAFAQVYKNINFLVQNKGASTEQIKRIMSDVLKESYPTSMFKDGIKFKITDLEKEAWFTYADVLVFVSKAIDRHNNENLGTKIDATEKQFYTHQLLNICDEKVLDLTLEQLARFVDESDPKDLGVRMKSVDGTNLINRIVSGCFDSDSRFSNKTLTALQSFLVESISPLKLNEKNWAALEAFAAGIVSPLPVHTAMVHMLGTPKTLNAKGDWDYSDTVGRTLKGTKNFFEKKLGVPVTEKNLLDLRLVCPLVASVLADDFSKKKFDEINKLRYMPAIPSLVFAKGEYLGLDDIYAMSNQIDSLHNEFETAVKNAGHKSFDDILADKNITSLLEKHNEALKLIITKDLPIYYTKKNGQDKNIQAIKAKLYGVEIEADLNVADTKPAEAPKPNILATLPTAYMPVSYDNASAQSSPNISVTNRASVSYPQNDNAVAAPVQQPQYNGGYANQVSLSGNRYTNVVSSTQQNGESELSKLQNQRRANRMSTYYPQNNGQGMGRGNQ
ncbi:MAG: hypothetical protein K0R98_1959, partial [Rickettsiaceae bacterium]|nr:hypothetical protein [Rickettsiaceae bacterium]